MVNDYCEQEASNRLALIAGNSKMFANKVTTYKQ